MWGARAAGEEALEHTQHFLIIVNTPFEKCKLKSYY
jgi:hypothetical protein